MSKVLKALDRYFDSAINGAVQGAVFCLILWLLDANVTINF